MTTSHLNPTPSGAFGTIAKLVRLSENLGVAWSHWKDLTNNPTALKNHAEYLKLGCPKVNADGMAVVKTMPDGADFARLILGDKFISPQDMMARAYGWWDYTDQQLAHFADTLPDLEKLLWLYSNNYLLIAGPANNDINLLGVFDLNNNLFSPCSVDWCEEEKQRFSRSDVVRSGEWLMLRKKDAPNSRLKRWRQQTELVIPPQRVPNIAEVAYGVAVYRKVRGVQLLPNIQVRTSSVDANDKHVRIGSHSRIAFSIDNDSDNDCHPYLGIAEAL